MKNLAFLVLILMTCYAAGMFQYQPLMFLFVLECVYFILMIVQVCYFKRHLSLSFLRPSDAAQKGSKYGCICKVRNTGKLPVSRFGLRVSFSYGQKIGSFKGNLFAGSECGDSNIQFQIYTKYCGLIETEIKWLKVYDYLSLGSLKKHLRQKMTLAVFPKERALHLVFDSFEGLGTALMERQLMRQTNHTYGEYSQSREYRPGDPTRHIHWNLSARTDQIWVREYGQEADFPVSLLLELDLFDLSIPDIVERMDAFYELLSALILGLLQHVSAVLVYWYGGEEMGLVSARVVDAADCRTLLHCLYEVDFLDQEPEEANLFFQNWATGREDFLRLTSGLCWYYGQALIYQFSEKELDREIEDQVYQIGGVLP